MLLFKVKKDTKIINLRVSNTSNGKTIHSRFIKNQEAKGLLTNLGIKTPLGKVPLLDNVLF